MLLSFVIGPYSKLVASSYARLSFDIDGLYSKPLAYSYGLSFVRGKIISPSALVDFV